MSCPQISIQSWSTEPQSMVQNILCRANAAGMGGMEKVLCLMERVFQRNKHALCLQPLQLQTEPERIKHWRITDGTNKTWEKRRPTPPLWLQNTIKTPLLSEISHIYRRLQPPKGFLLFLVLCLLGRRVMTSLPLLEFWLHVLPLVVLKTP